MKFAMKGIQRGFLGKWLLVFTSSVLLFPLLGQAQSAHFPLPPEWSKRVIWYQIFVERFFNGDTTNDPKPENTYTALSGKAPQGWAITPWTQNWYKQDSWAVGNGKSFNDNLQERRYGGDLQGVIDKLDYLASLGVTAIYLNPINDAPSLHKYDARYYHHVDVNFGPDPAGDNKIMESEDPGNPATWKWTSADKLFLKLVDEVHKRKMRIIMDYSWNHTGTEFWAFKDIVKNRDKSAYKDWYTVYAYDDPATPQNEFKYAGWYGDYLPELRKVGVSSAKDMHHPYEGNLNEGAKQHIFAVTKRWLAPNGDTTKGVDGYRLDVADFIPMGFWREYRNFVKSIKPDAYLVGEIQWWMDKMMPPAYYANGEVFDGVMFYHLYRPARSFFSLANDAIDAREFVDSLRYQWNGLEVPFRYSMMDVSSTHDTPRMLTSFYNHGKYKYRAKPYEDSLYKTGKPDAETYQRLKLYLIHQFTNVGAPDVWNGEEMGMWGADDPDCRKPLWWKDLTFQPETRNNIQPGPAVYDSVGFNQEWFDFYKKLIGIRNGNSVLATGKIDFVEAQGKTLVYKRYDKDACIYVLFNLESSGKTFTLPEKGSYKNLLDGSAIDGDAISLEPLSAAILSRVK